MPADFVLVGTVQCNVNSEFLFDYGFTVSAAQPTTEAYIAAIEITNSSGLDNRLLPRKADITVNRRTALNSSEFQITATGLCCPR